MQQSLARIHSIVLGPGLGRHPNTMQQVSCIVAQSLKLKIPMVLDGDALWLLSQPMYRGILSEHVHPNVILTPNAMEFRRLWINHILRKDVNGKLDQNKDHYLPPFDTTSLFDKVMGNSKETDSAKQDEEKDDG